MTEQQAIPSDPASDSQSEHGDHWRDQITARVAGYSRRRGRRIEGAFSMRFPFPPAETEAALITERPEWEADTADTADETLPAAAANDGAPAQAMPEPPTLDTFAVVTGSQSPAADADDSKIAIDTEAPEPVSFAIDLPRPLPTPATDGANSRPRAKRKVIAFPRPASSPPEIVHRLADPIVPERPRILDVPEELEAYPATPLFDGLQFLPSPQSAATPPADHVELPFQAVDISQRVYAGAIDCALVAAAAGLFAGVCYKMLPKLPVTKPLVMIAAGVLVLLWGIYQYIFTMYAAATPGMRMLRLRFSCFKGGRLSWRHRRSRVLGLYFSTASLMMGLLWALVDIDALCWHDRISRSYLSKQE